MLAFLQKIGRSLMIPIAIMPAAALLLRLGAEDVFNIPFVQAAGTEIFAYLPLLFAAGIAIGMSDDQRGEAVLAAIVAYFVLLKGLTILLIEGGSTADADIVTKLSGNVLIGIIAGLITIYTYNNFRKIKLPDALGFFSGRRLVPILTSLFALIAALILDSVWPYVWNGLATFNNVILHLGEFGTALFGTLNRLLIPLGLHHVLNSFFWFQLGEFTTTAGNVVAGDIPRFLAGDPTAGRFQVGFYPIMMFGLPGGAIGIILAAKPENRKKAMGLLGSAALVSFVTGITEPLEFTFIFVAPLLFGVHILLTALSNFITFILDLRHGFGFSAGLIDFVLNYGLAYRPLVTAAIGVVFFFIYMGTFYGLIKLFNLKTPGREDEALEENVVIAGVLDSDDKHTIMAKGILEAIGGRENVVAIDNCATRLRLTVIDSSLANEARIKALGASGMVRPSKTALQVIVGVAVEFVADAMKDVVAAQGSGSAPAVPVAAEAEPEQDESIDKETSRQRISGFIAALGGKDNITQTEAAGTTRLHAVLKDAAVVDEAALRSAGAKGVFCRGKDVNLLVGAGGPVYAEEFSRQLN